LRHAPSRIFHTVNEETAQAHRVDFDASSRERTLIDMRVCAIARSPLISRDGAA